jgi:polyferredoxin
MYKYLKGIRVTFSLIFYLGITFLFLDFTGLFHSFVYNGFTFLQFIPSVIKFFTIGGILALGFFVILLINLLIGRVYCSIICPLGVLQDIISFFSKKFRKKKFRFKYSKPFNLLRFTILGVVILGVLFGSISLVYILDPYSTYGRIVSDLGKPFYIWGNNFFAGIFEKMHIYAIYPVDAKKINWIGVMLPIVFVGVIFWMALTKGRLYCNTICPVGSLLGLVSKFSIFKLKIVEKNCIKCGKCSFACKSSCINVKDHKLDFSRCVSCFNCVQSCDSSALVYKYTWGSVKKSVTEPTDESKRGFIIKSALLTFGILGYNYSLNAVVKGVKKLRTYKKKWLVTPPGSKSIDHFTKTCTACHLCVSACPTGVLQPRMFESGSSQFLQPFMDPSTNYCNFECTKCGEVCPTGAIQSLSVNQKKVTQIGMVTFLKDNCVVFTNETSCGSCSEHCPTQAVQMVPYKGKLTIPNVNPEICIGCGACEHACPVRPFRAIYVEGNPIHKIAKKPQTKKIEEIQSEEFPF